jgi:hypothetical protein
MVTESPNLGIRKSQGHLHEAQGQRIMLCKSYPPHSNRGTNRVPDGRCAAVVWSYPKL